MAGAIRVKGLREFQRACNKADKATKTGLRKRLRAAAEPVRSEAAHRAASEIRNIGPRWSQMKVGVSGRGVYVAPSTRPSGGSSRPNFGRKLMFEAMVPALDAKRDEVIREFEDMLDEIVDGF